MHFQQKTFLLLKSACCLVAWTILGFSLFGPTVSLAQDAVYQKNSAPGAKPSKWTGQITDYTGRELKLQLSSGRERVIPAAAVEGIETTYAPAHLAADQLFAAGKFDQALAQYNTALRNEEKRNWVRRQIMAQQVWCYQELGQTLFAVRTFQLLVQSDPETQFFDCIPLAWLPQELPVTLEREAQMWLESRESALDVLIGLSWMMASNQRQRAIARAEELAGHTDARIAWLARAQLWRGQATTADEPRLADWRASLEKIPFPLRAGPTYLLGQELARRQQHDPASLLLLRVPIHYPNQRRLSARCLLTAAQALEKSQHPDESITLYQEVLQRYRDLPDATAEASGRLSSLAP